MYVEPKFGRSKICELVKSDVKRFYNTLVDQRGLAISTVDGVHTVLHQVFDMAVDDCRAHVAAAARGADIVL